MNKLINKFNYLLFKGDVSVIICIRDSEEATDKPEMGRKTCGFYLIIVIWIIHAWILD